MLATRSFHVVFVGRNHGVGIEPSAASDKVVQYSGKELTVVP
jgi:hypothetical protein